MLALYLTLFNNMATDTFSKTDMRLHIFVIMCYYDCKWLFCAHLILLAQRCHWKIASLLVYPSTASYKDMIYVTIQRALCVKYVCTQLWTLFIFCYRLSNKENKSVFCRQYRTPAHGSWVDCNNLFLFCISFFFFFFWLTVYDSWILLSFEVVSNHHCY